MKISEMQQQAYENAFAHGWHSEERSFGELIALCHSELSEALEEYRKGYLPSTAYYSYTGNDTAKPEGIPSELADVVIRIADMCGQYGIDLEKIIIEKMKYNESRPYKHGGKTI